LPIIKEATLTISATLTEISYVNAVEEVGNKSSGLHRRRQSQRNARRKEEEDNKKVKHGCIVLEK
jgi:hypothetical protein